VRTIEQTLDSAVPDWRQINEDPRFIQWLQGREVLSGRARMELLDDASAAGDADRIVAMFKHYLSEQSQATPPTQAPQAAQSSVVDPASLVAPTRLPVGQVSPDAALDREKPIIRVSQVRQFYRDVTDGKYRTRPKDKQSFEEAIFEAQREGRLRPD
jgi:hypothetical protein